MLLTYSYKQQQQQQPFNDRLSRMTRVGRYTDLTFTHSHPVFLCGYYTTSLTNFLHFLSPIASSLNICLTIFFYNLIPSSYSYKTKVKAEASLEILQYLE